MKILLTMLSFVILTVGIVGNATALVYNSTAGDVDYAADRNAYDVTSNMDYFVFGTAFSASGAATNSLGYVEWDYSLPFETTTANSGSMTIRSWDIDLGDEMNVYFNFGSERIFAGELTGSNGGNVTTWENAVAAGTTATLSGWSTTSFDFSTILLDALSGSTGFVLELDVINNATESWAAVIDYASLTLDYEPGRANPDFEQVPEPSTILLLGSGLACLAFYRRRRKE